MSQYNNHPYNNHVIKVKSREHGKQVIAWWKSQGVDTILEGLITEEDNCSHIYYGILGGDFHNYEKPSLGKVIELPEGSSSSNPPDFVLPEKWCVLTDDKNVDIVCNYYEKQFGREGFYNRNLGYYHHSDNLIGELIMNGGKFDKCLAFQELRKRPGYTFISTEQFVKYVVNAPSISAPSSKKEVVKDRAYYESFIGREAVGVGFSDIIWNPDMGKYIGKKGEITVFFPNSNSFRIKFSNGPYWHYPAELILQQFESKPDTRTEINIPAVQKVSTKIKPDLSKPLPEIKISLPKVEPKQIGRIVIEKVNIKI
jgi:hypothetical protein